MIVEVVDVDENMHAPAFSDPAVLTASVPEDAQRGTTVLVATATDADPPGRDSRLAYYIVGGSGMAHFSIDDTGIVSHTKTQLRGGRHDRGLGSVSYYVIPVPGVIRTVTPLDREAVPHYWLTVAAEDHGLVPRYTTVQVVIHI